MFSARRQIRYLSQLARCPDCGSRLRDGEASRWPSPLRKLIHYASGRNSVSGGMKLPREPASRAFTGRPIADPHPAPGRPGAGVAGCRVVPADGSKFGASTNTAQRVDPAKYAHGRFVNPSAISTAPAPSRGQVAS